MHTLSDIIKSRVKISEVISRYCKIQILGQRMVISCPFHMEKTPSCYIQNDKCRFHCFGCSESGDIFTFVQKMHNISFRESCLKIADWYGIQVQEKHQFTAIKKYIQILNHLTTWFHDNLLRSFDTLKYLQMRNIVSNTQNQFKLGYFSTLKQFQQFCHDNKITKENLTYIGLPYSLLNIMQKRIIFPIFDNTNSRQVIAFGARKISDANNFPKYINSAESTLFSKKQSLYGLHYLHSSTQKYKEIFLVEGYLDVLTLFQFDIPSVATLGTAANATHLQTLWSKYKNITVCFDGDIAGQNAMQKLAVIALSTIQPGHSISFIKLPNDLDPANFLNIHTKNDWNHLPRISLVRFCWESANLASIYHTKGIEHAVKAYENLCLLTKETQNSYIKNLYLKTWKNYWYEEVHFAGKLQHNKKNTQLTQNASKKHYINSNMTYIKILFSTIIHHPSIIDYVCDELLNIELTQSFDNMREALLKFHEQYLEKNYKKTLDFLHENEFTDMVNVCCAPETYQLAPFILQSNDIQQISQHWKEVYKLYLNTIQSK